MAFVEVQGLDKVFPDGTKALDAIELDAEPGEFVVLVGPSGCGKSTLLRILSGLETASEGTITLAGEEISLLDPRERDIAMIFQDYALYPNMTVAENLRFPLKIEGMPKADARALLDQVARILDLGPLLDRKPSQLSGGQRQRVAMGRALVRSPQLFLMDEPLSNLDSKLRVQMRAEIRSLQAQLGVTTFYVTHDQVEAMTMGDRIAVLNFGVLQQYDTPREIFERPANIFVGRFIGSPEMNTLAGAIEGGKLRLGEWSADISGHGEGVTDVVVGIRPQHWDVVPVGGIRGRVTYTEWLGTSLQTHLRVDGVEQLGELGADGFVRHDDATVMVSLQEDSPVAVGDTLSVVPRPGFAHIFDDVTGERLDLTTS